MIENIRKNIITEMNMLKEISIYSNRLDFAVTALERKLLLTTIKALQNSIGIINDSIPSLLSEISLTKKLPLRGVIEKNKLEAVTYKKGDSEFKAIIPSRVKKKLLKELSIGESSLKKLRRRYKETKEEYVEFKAASGYLKLANKLFLDQAIRLINKGYLKNLSIELRKANIDLLFQVYVAMILMTTSLSFIIASLITGLLFFFNIGIAWPFISIYDGNYLVRLLQIFWIPIISPVAVFFALYYYPITEKKSIARRINQELPFAVIHMSAISGSGIEPTEIFRIIGLSREYPYLRKEIRKVINQINLFGYDLVTALNNTASGTPSTKLTELFSGLATTITSGGNFSDFFNRRAETLLISYRIEREKYSKTAETFMDIYISVVIAAPMILMLFLILLLIGNFNLGLSISQLTFLIIAVITIVNIFFIMFIHMRQPTY